MKEVWFMTNAGFIRRHFLALLHPVSLRILPLSLLLLAAPLSAQQTDVRRFDAFAGYAFLDSPHIGLFENGFALQFGVRPRTWFSLGIDYTRATGDLNLTPALLPTSLLPALAPILAQAPAGYVFQVPAHSVTQTFAAGPQLAYRHLQHVTLFLRPVFAGIIHEGATPMPIDPFQTAAVHGFTALGLVPSSGTKTDNVLFYGFGGGFDILFNKHIGWRTQADLVYDHLFSDLLKDGRFTVRFSTGPCFNFGKNIAR
jgi:hypothetical protein